MESEELTGLDAVKHELEPNEFINVHVTCVELLPASSEKLRQVGRLEDETGTQCKFMSWENSDQPELTQGDSYLISDAQTMTDRDEGAAIVFRAQTEIRDAEHPSGGDGATGPDCLFCSEPMPHTAYNEGPGAPEVGWEYYHCPSCGKDMRADRV